MMEQNRKKKNKTLNIQLLNSEQMWDLNYKGSTYIQEEGYSILSGDHGLLAEDSDQMGLSSISGQYKCVLCVGEIVKFIFGDASVFHFCKANYLKFYGLESKNLLFTILRLEQIVLFSVMPVRVTNSIVFSQLLIVACSAYSLPPCYVLVSKDFQCGLCLQKNKLNTFLAS